MKYVKKIKIIDPTNWSHHRSGWPYCLRFLSLLQTNNGCVFIDSIDRMLKRHTAYKHIDSSWIGFAHNTPIHPKIMRSIYPDANSLQDMFQSPIWDKYSKNCKGIFVFSKYCEKYINQTINVPTESLIHPTYFSKITFEFNEFIKNTDKKIIVVGHWMRDFQEIFDLKTKIYKKFILNCSIFPYFEMPTVIKTNNSVGLLPNLSNKEYDILLSKNLIFLPLYDSSANNALIECIVRNTPVLIKKLPATIEYLGKDYPMFYNTLKEAEEKLKNIELINKTFIYLQKKDKTNFKIKNFFESFVNSNIYKNLNIDLTKKIFI